MGSLQNIQQVQFHGNEDILSPTMHPEPSVGFFTVTQVRHEIARHIVKLIPGDQRFAITLHRFSLLDRHKRGVKNLEKMAIVMFICTLYLDSNARS